jgi:hypothetical protein
LQIHPHPGGDFLDAYRECPWLGLPSHELLCPCEGYVLHYDPKPRAAPLVFLAFEGELVGVFESDNLTVADSHQGSRLGPELILAGFAQAPWKDLKERKVTEAGAGALRSAHRLAKEVLVKLKGE